MQVFRFEESIVMLPKFVMYHEVVYMLQIIFSEGLVTAQYACEKNGVIFKMTNTSYEQVIKEMAIVKNTEYYRQAWSTIHKIQ